MIVYDFTSDSGDCVVHKESSGWKSRYDRAVTRAHKLKQKIEALNEKPDLTSKDRSRLAVLRAQLERAEEAKRKELRRDLDDVARRQNTIDEWRATDGRETYNASRRKKRIHANADLSGLTDEQKLVHRADQKDAARFRQSKLKAGWTEARIEAALITRFAERKAKRAAQAEAQTRHDDDDAAMRADAPARF